MKILIIQNKRIGDVLLASIIPNNIKKSYPNSHITFFCYDNAAPVLENNPNIDSVIAVKEKELKKLKTLARYVLFIRKEKFDLIIDPYVKFQSQVLSLISGAVNRVSYKKLTLPFAYTKQIPILKENTSVYGKAIDDRLNLITSIDSSIKPDPYPKLFLTPAEVEHGKQLLSKLDASRKTMMIGVLGSNVSKSLPIEYTVEIIDFLVAHYNLNILLNYIPSQQPIVDDILGRIKDSDKVYPEIVGKNIREFIQIMQHCDLLIANEGGSVHIAKALKKATFTIFSPYIVKDFWATFENEPQNRSIHLKEVRPDLFEDQSRKEISAKSEELYREFTPALILPRLKTFMTENGF
ncbi:glycosyltransferase family 9 protein [Salinimicrobium tongyeongense]|uniref:Glycosyltransferase family 9 protein n=1 Tax=Salinimicrobium tongyeongense TaxID=2809707 RepID=A0ABY6NPM3_9FLAO|nr:glycosyltransferase family 9 protein [Salinimicrobium tongyeongense]UZH54837.1 glycosyltransferase family 9 protein [Salinimicrobium tongyeongense]